MGYVVTASTGFTAIGCHHRISATEPAALERAVRIARDHLAQVDRAASRFRVDSEVMTLANLPGDGHGMVRTAISPLLASLVAGALEAAQWTEGLVDPTLGRALIGQGYDQDIDELGSREGFSPSSAQRTDWTRITLSDTEIELPAGTLLDLGATAKAQTADEIAGLLAARLPGGFLVSLGGDVATAGTPPRNGWAVAVTRQDSSVAQLVTTRGVAVATSSTQHRTWRTDHGVAHHILDPRTGRPADPVWASVTCAAGSAGRANAASTAAVVLGEQAPQWLSHRGVPARLERPDGPVVTTLGWPTGHGALQPIGEFEVSA